MNLIPFKKKEPKKISIDFANILLQDPSSQKSLLKLRQAVLKSKLDLEKAVEESFQKIKQTSSLEIKDNQPFRK